MLTTSAAVGEFFALREGGDHHAGGSRAAGRAPCINVGGARGGSESEEPGATVRIFSTLDVLGSVPAAYATVLQTAARFAGVGTDDVAGIVERFERRLVRRRRDQNGARVPNTEGT